MDEPTWLCSANPWELLAHVLGEAEWDESAEAYVSRDPLVSSRQLLLYLADCCRLVWDEIAPERFAAVADWARRQAPTALADSNTSPDNLALITAFIDRGGWGADDFDVLREAVRSIEARADGPNPDRLSAETERIRQRILEIPSLTEAISPIGLNPAFRNQLMAFEEATVVVSQALRRPQDAAWSIHWSLGSALAFAAAPPGVWPAPPSDEQPIIADLVRDVVGNPFRPFVFESAWKSADAVAIARGMYDEHDFAGMPVLADALEEAGCTDAAVLAHCRVGSRHVRGCWVVDRVLTLPRMLR